MHIGETYSGLLQAVTSIQLCQYLHRVYIVGEVTTRPVEHPTHINGSCTKNIVITECCHRLHINLPCFESTPTVCLRGCVNNLSYMCMYITYMYATFRGIKGVM